MAQHHGDLGGGSGATLRAVLLKLRAFPWFNGEPSLARTALSDNGYGTILYSKVQRCIKCNEVTSFRQDPLQACTVVVFITSHVRSPPFERPWQVQLYGDGGPDTAHSSTSARLYQRECRHCKMRYSLSYYESANQRGPVGKGQHSGTERLAVRHPLPRDLRDSCNFQSTNDTVLGYTLFKHYENDLYYCHSSINGFIRSNNDTHDLKKGAGLRDMSSDGLDSQSSGQHSQSVLDRREELDRRRFTHAWFQYRAVKLWDDLGRFEQLCSVAKCMVKLWRFPRVTGTWQS